MKKIVCCFLVFFTIISSAADKTKVYHLPKYEDTLGVKMKLSVKNSYKYTWIYSLFDVNKSKGEYQIECTVKDIRKTVDDDPKIELVVTKLDITKWFSTPDLSNLLNKPIVGQYSSKGKHKYTIEEDQINDEVFLYIVSDLSLLSKEDYFKTLLPKNGVKINETWKVDANETTRYLAEHKIQVKTTDIDQTVTLEKIGDYNGSKCATLSHKGIIKNIPYINNQVTGKRDRETVSSRITFAIDNPYEIFYGKTKIRMSGYLTLKSNKKTFHESLEIDNTYKARILTD